MKKLIFMLMACSVISLGYAQMETGAKKQCASKDGAKKVCTAAEKAACDAKKASIAKTASLEAEGYLVSKSEKTGSVTATKTCATSGKLTTVKTCGESGKTVKTVMDKEGNLVSKDVISGEAVAKNAATTEEVVAAEEEVTIQQKATSLMDDLTAEGFTMKQCASSGSTTAKKICAQSGKVTKYKETAEGVVTKTVMDKEGNVLSSETVEAAAQQQDKKAVDFKFANLEADGYEMGSCAKSGSKTASKTCAASGTKTAFKQCGASGKVTKTVMDKEGTVISEEIMKNAATVEEGDQGFNLLDLEKEGYTMKSCADSGNKYASKSCAASGKETSYKQCGASGKVTKTVMDKEGKVISEEIMKNAATVEQGDQGFNLLDLEKEGFTMKNCAASGSKYASKSCAASGKETSYKQCGASGKVTKTVTDKEGKIISEEIMKNAATVEEGDQGFNLIDLEKEGFAMKSCASSGSKYANKSCAASGKETSYKQCGASGKVTKTVTDKEGVVLSSEVVSNGKADIPAITASAKKKGCCAGKSAKSCAGKKTKSASASE